jgi:hypothetical protein
LAAQIGPTARAGAQLRRGKAVQAIVGIQAGYDAILNVGQEQAASTAVVGRASHSYNSFL